MKREKRLTKRERKALAGGPRPQGTQTGGQHIHCIACGRHIDPHEFNPPATATRIACQHRSTFPTCLECIEISRGLLAEHDRTGQAVRTASAWH
jgi:hypothetical protein